MQKLGGFLSCRTEIGKRMFNQFIPLINVTLSNMLLGTGTLLTLNVASSQNLHMMDHEANHNEFFWTRSQSTLKHKSNFSTLSLYNGTDLVACMAIYTTGNKVRVERIEVRGQYSPQFNLLAFFVFTALAEIAATNVGFVVVLRSVHQANWIFCKILGYHCSPNGACLHPCQLPCKVSTTCTDFYK
jgi:hypothetical protein